MPSVQNNDQGYVYSVLLLVSSGMLIVGHLIMSQRLNVYNILLHTKFSYNVHINRGLKDVSNQCLESGSYSIDGYGAHCSSLAGKLHTGAGAAETTWIGGAK